MITSVSFSQNCKAFTVTEILTSESKVYNFKDVTSTLHITITNTCKDPKIKAPDRGWLIVRDLNNDTIAGDYLTELPLEFNVDRTYMIFVKDDYKKAVLNKKVKLSLVGFCEDLHQKYNLVPKKIKNEEMAYERTTNTKRFKGGDLLIIILDVLLILSKIH